jgi:putative membrane protein
MAGRLGLSSVGRSVRWMRVELRSVFHLHLLPQDRGEKPMKHTILIAVVASALTAAPAIAQYSSTPKTQPEKKAATSADTAVAAKDKAFAKDAALGGMAEVELGTLAKEKASSPDVKKFGERMVTDHTKANDELKKWATEKNLTLPSELDAKDKATHDRLAKLSGDAFDKAYMADMVSDHVKDVSEFKKQSTGAKDPDLKAFVTKTLPTLEDHLKEARDVKAKLGATGHGNEGSPAPKK